MRRRATVLQVAIYMNPGTIKAKKSSLSYRGTERGRSNVALELQLGLKDPWTRQQRKRRLKSELAFFQPSSRLFLATQILRQM